MWLLAPPQLLLAPLLLMLIAPLLLLKVPPLLPQMLYNGLRLPAGMSSVSRTGSAPVTTVWPIAHTLDTLGCRSAGGGAAASRAGAVWRNATSSNRGPQPQRRLEELHLLDGGRLGHGIIDPIDVVLKWPRVVLLLLRRHRRRWWRLPLLLPPRRLLLFPLIPLTPSRGNLTVLLPQHPLLMLPSRNHRRWTRL